MRTRCTDKDKDCKGLVAPETLDPQPCDFAAHSLKTSGLPPQRLLEPGSLYFQARNALLSRNLTKFLSPAI